MLIRTWGFVATKPHAPWVSVEVLAERGALVRASGLPSGAAQESVARLRAALAHVGLSPPTQSLNLHVHPTCTKEDVPHLDLALAAALLRLCDSLSAHDLLRTAYAGTLTLSGGLRGPTLGPGKSLPKPHTVAPSDIQRLVHAPDGDGFLPDSPGLECRWEISTLLELVNSTPSWRKLSPPQ